MAISDADYNQARGILARAGSMTARNSHEKHTQGNGSPIGHGQALLREARDEFLRMDNGSANLRQGTGMTVAHYNAIHDAARVMAVQTW
ncbi:MAG: hypothetical protein ABII79_11495 [bacterium]